MVDTRALRRIIAEQGYSQRQVAMAIGISSRTFYDHLKRGIFNTDEVVKMIPLLNIENPIEIFLRPETN